MLSLIRGVLGRKSEISALERVCRPRSTLFHMAQLMRDNPLAPQELTQLESSPLPLAGSDIVCHSKFRLYLTTRRATQRLKSGYCDLVGWWFVRLPQD